MIEVVAEINYWLAFCTIGLQLVTAYLFIEYFFMREKYLAPYLARFGMFVILLFGAVSVVLTLVYSEIFGFVPCGLCWLQRVFLYPLPVVAAITLLHKSTGAVRRVIADSGITLSVLGAIVALYQHYLQMGGSEFVACPTAGVGADCARRILFEFGYITFPLMSATVFLFVIVTLLIYRRGVSREAD